MNQLDSIDSLDTPIIHTVNTPSSIKSTEVNQPSVLNVKEIEHICQSIMSPFTDMANIFKDSNILIIKNQMTMFLTAQLMRAEKGNGLKNLNRWINQVENCASSDSLRILESRSRCFEPYK